MLAQRGIGQGDRVLLITQLRRTGAGEEKDYAAACARLLALHERVVADAPPDGAVDDPAARARELHRGHSIRLPAADA